MRELYKVYRYTKGIFEGGPVFSSSVAWESDKKCKEYNARVTHLVNTKYIVLTDQEKLDIINKKRGKGE